MIRQETQLNFLRELVAQSAPDFLLQSFEPLSGGSINEVLKLKGEKKNLVLKLNDAQRYPGMFEAEAKGLRLLANPEVIRVPEVIACGELDGQSYLLLEAIETGSRSGELWEQFGKQLAALHLNTNEQFGLDHHNYMGSLTQLNTFEDSWTEFFVLHRLQPQLRMAYDAGFLKSEKGLFEKLIAKLGDLVPQEKPALIHGDLWGGNYLVDESRRPVLIDPAVHYGHREADISMMHLFGGFASEIFDHYNSVSTLEKGWRQRVDIHNLYPLLVHVNLFGGGYTSQVSSILRRFA